MLGLTVAAMALAAVACTRDSVGECAELAPGDLVITEFRGEQTTEDIDPIWVEVYNASSGTLDLEGVKIRFRKVDGSSEVPILVRRSVTVPAGDYAVLGLISDILRPEYMDYGFGDDFHVGFLAAAAVDIETCGTQIDRARYDNLPKTGTYSFGGTPSAENNDVLTMWCTNDSFNGTPGEMNPPCPP